MKKSSVLTPDGRYLVIEGKLGPRLWRTTNPTLSQEEREHWVSLLMDARRSVGAAGSDEAKLAAARERVDVAKRALGERGLPWWTDGAPDLNRVMVKNSPYQDWYTDMTSCGGPSERSR